MFKVLNEYSHRVIKTIPQGKTLKDKAILLLYFLKSPIFLISYIKDVRHSYKLLSNVMIKNKHGVFFCGNDIWNVYVVLNDFEVGVKKELTLEEGAFLDVGANIGIHTIPTATKYSNNLIVAIEPQETDMLEKNIEINGLSNVVVIKKGCYSEKKNMALNICPFGSGGHTLVTDLWNNAPTVNIEVDTVDNIVKQLKIKKVDLIKIDVEKAELNVILGTKETLIKHHPKLIIEITRDFEKVKKILNSYGYTKLCLIDGRKNYVATYQ